MCDYISKDSLAVGSGTSCFCVAFVFGFHCGVTALKGGL